jgi:Flp pilus assembly protein TadD
VGQSPCTCDAWSMQTSNNITSLLEKAYQRFDQGDLTGAQKHGKKILKNDPAHFDAHLLLGKILAEREKFSQAETHFTACVTAQPKNAAAHYNLGFVLEKKKRFAKASECYRQSSDLDPSDPNALFSLANTLEVLENIEEAIVVFRRCTWLDRQNSLAHYNLAALLWETGQLDEAETVIRRAMKLDPNDTNIHAFLGVILAAKGQIDLASEAITAPFKRIYGLDSPRNGTESAFCKVHEIKLRHDIEQLEYLIETGKLSAEYDGLVQDYKKVLGSLPDAPFSDINKLFPLPSQRFRDSYNRILHYHPPAAILGGALNTDIDTGAIEDAYFGQDYGMAAFDNFLKPEALSALRTFFMQSTQWFDVDIPGEVGASIKHGICCPLLVQVAEETRAAFPRIFKDVLFHNTWSYKFYSRRSGVPVHADDGKISINFWLTPDEANLNPETGGLTFWKERVPIQFFGETPDKKSKIMQKIIDDPAVEPFIVPYGSNKVALFESRLLHKTNEVEFKDGYENRRVNLTILYGRPMKHH